MVIKAFIFLINDAIQRKLYLPYALFCNKQELPYETVLIIAIVQIVNASHFMLERYECFLK